MQGNVFWSWGWVTAHGAAVADTAAEGPGSLVQGYLALGVPVLRWLQVPVCHRNKRNLGIPVTPLK